MGHDQSAHWSVDPTGYRRAQTNSYLNLHNTVKLYTGKLLNEGSKNLQNPEMKTIHLEEIKFFNKSFVTW